MVASRSVLPSGDCKKSKKSTQRLIYTYMRVLVLGGTQFIGRASVGALLSRGHAVTVLNRGRSPNPFGAAVSHIACDRRGSGLAAALASEAVKHEGAGPIARPPSGMPSFKLQ